MRSFLIYAALLVVIALMATSADARLASPIQSLTPPPAAGNEDPALLGPAGPPETDHTPRVPLDAPLGQVYVAGTTWYDLQHYGSAGKMIGVSDSGFAHLVWTKSVNGGGNPRHVYYNVWDPNTQQMRFTPAGAQADISNSALRSGYACLAMLSKSGPSFPEGWAFPAFHELLSGALQHSAAGMDFLPGAGAFEISEPSYLFQSGNPLELIWPKLSMGQDCTLHMVSTHNVPVLGEPQRIYYSRGIPDWDYDGFGMGIDWQIVASGGVRFKLMDTTWANSADIVASKMSDRVAMAWTRARPVGDLLGFNSDVYLEFSEDGGITWGPRINLTDFAPQDTFRAYADVSLVFDDQDYLHVAFTTREVMEEANIGYVQRSMIWHWSEESNQFSALASAWYWSLEGSPGAWMLNVNRPSLSIDPVTDFVYCSYQGFDTTYISTHQYFNADAWVTVSTDGGVHWAVGRNVTDTHPAVNPAPAGQSQSERDITLADRVSYTGGTGFLHLEWELDRDAGTTALNEGVATQNTIYYQRISVNDIPLSPLMPTYSLHVQGSPAAHRCCYNVGQPTCAMMSYANCVALGGAWTADPSVTCESSCDELPPIVCTCQEEPNTYCNLNGGTIPDGDMNGADFILNVPVQYHITDVNVCLNITIDYTAATEITLRSPDGTIVPLSLANGGGPNYSCTVFDDEAVAPINQGNSPFNGSYRPETPLSAFDGENAYGEWVLHVADSVSFNFGHLDWFCLSFNYDQILPVELTTFSATAQAQGIEIAFRTASETSTDHFELMRGTSENGNFERIANWASEGSSSSGHAYSYLDENVTAGWTYWYYLVDVSVTGERTEHRDLMSSATMLEAPIPLEYSLSAYPNPFNPETTLRFGIAQPGEVTLVVFNLNGQWMRNLTQRRYDAGTYYVTFDAGDLPSGIYFARLTAGAFVQTEKLVLMK
jgi:subtilisin-like proprotein convertase family protein